MAEMIFDSLGYAQGVVWKQDGGWVAKYFIETYSIEVHSQEAGREWVLSHTENRGRT